MINYDEIKEKAYVLEEKVLLKHQDKEFIATLKGVSPSYKNLTNFDSLMIDGNYLDAYENNNVAVIGRGVAYYLSLGIGNLLQQLQVYLPDRSLNTLLNPQNAFKEGNLAPIGVFGIQAEIDEQYIITTLAFIQKLSNRENEISAIELQLKDSNMLFDVQRKLQNHLGGNFIVKNRYEQHEFLYKILNTEKLAVFLILAFIMIISTFTIVGSLTMLILDKKHDINTLRSIGVTTSNIQHIFFTKSMLTIFSGTIFGLLLGVGLAFLQQIFGFITMGGSFIVNSYPISIKLTDVFLVFTTVTIIGLIGSWYPTRILTKKLV